MIKIAILVYVIMKILFYVIYIAENIRIKIYNLIYKGNAFLAYVVLFAFSMYNL